MADIGDTSGETSQIMEGVGVALITDTGDPSGETSQIMEGVGIASITNTGDSSEEPSQIMEGVGVASITDTGDPSGEPSQIMEGVGIASITGEVLTTEESHSPQYQAVLHYKAELERCLAGGPDQHLLNQFKIRGWLGDEADAGPTQLIDEALQRIKSNPSNYDVFIGMLPEDIRVKDQITEMCSLSSPPESTPALHGLTNLSSLFSPYLLQSLIELHLPARIGSYLREHKEVLSVLEEQEKTLRQIILQAAATASEEYGIILSQAIDLLSKVQQKLKQADPKRQVNGVNFADGRGPEILWNKQFYSPLMHACEEGHVERVALLLTKGAKVGFVSGQSKVKPTGKQKLIGSRMNAMHVACVKGRVEVVKLLIAGAKSNLKNVLNAKTKDNWTPLMYCVKEGHSEVVKLLLKNEELDILATNKKGQTALHVAGLHGRLECLKLIHAKLAEQIVTREKLQQTDPQNPYLSTDKKGYNVLHRVCKGPKGASDTNITIQCLQWMLETMPHLDKPEFLNMKTQEGYSCLLLACDCNNRDLVEYLLKEKGVDVSLTTVDGKTGLHIAALHDYPEIADLLMDEGISISAQDNERKSKDSEQMVGMDTALHIAVRKSSASVEGRIRSRSQVSPDILIIQNKMGQEADAVKPEEIIPQEIRRLGEPAVNRYRQLLRQGKKKKMPRCNLIALGEQRVGKTSLLCLLVGGEFILNRDPTRGIHNEKVDVLSSVSVSSETWKEVKAEDVAKHNESQFASSIAEDFEHDFARNQTVAHPTQPDELRKIMEEVKKLLKEIEEAAQAHSTGNVPIIPRAKRPAEPQRKSGDNSAKAPKRQKSSVPSITAAQSENTPTEREKSAITSARKTLTSQPKLGTTAVSRKVQVRPQVVRSQPSTTQEVVSSPRMPKIGRHLSKTIVSTAKKGSASPEAKLQYNTLDFAGQKEYRAMHHCFIVRRAIYLVVFNLQILRDALKGSNEETQRAHEEIRYWMNSIHAHIHKMGADETLKRILLVGTHRCPPGKEAVTQEQLHEIDEMLEEMFSGTQVLNDLFKSGETWISPVENSLDGPENREESGATTLQKAIRDAWNELPFRDEAYPTTWLRFEAYLQRKRHLGEHSRALIVNAGDIRQTAKEEFGIGEEKEEDIEMALGFFHDTGTIVYPRMLPALYLKEEEKKVLDDLILLSPHWLTTMMRNVMELKAGRGLDMTNEELMCLEKTGCAELNLLQRCWPDLGDEDFYKLVLMLQSFCLVFPLPEPETKDGAQMHSQPDEPSQQETPVKSHSFTRQPNQVYLIPSKLKSEEFDEKLANMFNVSFQFDFGGFLPEEVYHRLLCLMLKKLPKRNQKLKEIFTANYFKIYRVEKCNWVVRMINSKLCVWVKHGESDVPPSSYVNLIHMDYLQKICNENGSSLQGLKYIGGPVHICEENDNQPEVIPCVSFPDEEKVEDLWECPNCLKPMDVEKLLNPKYVPKVKPASHSTAGGITPSEGTPFVTQPASATFNITARHVIVPQPHSRVNFQIESEAALPQLPEGVPSNQIEGERTGSAENPFLCNTTNSEDEIMPHLMLLTDFTVIMVYSIKTLQLSQVALSLPRGLVPLAIKLQPVIHKAQKPKLPQLINLTTRERKVVKVVAGVADKWKMLGVLLLEDNDGAVVKSLSSQFNSKSTDITMEILSRWLRGEGAQPVTWKTLIDSLNSIGLSELASSIE